MRSPGTAMKRSPHSPQLEEACVQRRRPTTAERDTSHGGLLCHSGDLMLTWACVLGRFSHVWLFATLWTVAHQAPLSVGFSRQEYWSGLPCPPPGDLPDPGIEPLTLTSCALSGGFFTSSTTVITALKTPSPNLVPFWDEGLGLQHMNLRRYNSGDMSLSKLQERVKGQGSLACRSPRSCEESDMTEWLNDNDKFSP